MVDVDADVDADADADADVARFPDPLAFGSGFQKWVGEPG